MKEWKKKIEDSARDLEVPESLRPDKIEEKLKHKRKVKPFYRSPAVLAAAAAVLAVTGIWGVQKSLNMDKVSLSGQAETAKAIGQEENEEAEATSEDIADGAAYDGSSEEETNEACDVSDGEEGIDPESEFGKYYHTATYQEIKEQMKAAWEEREMSDVVRSDGTMDATSYSGDTEAAAESAAAEDTGDVSTVEAYSTTNLQVEGVDEGDIVKTDGTYIYILSSDSKIQVVKAETMEIAAEIPAQQDDGNVTYQEMYVDNGLLIVAGDYHESSLQESAEDVYYMDSSNKTVMVTYDLSDINNPKQVGKVSQDGYYRTSRKVGDTVYLFSNYYCTLGDDLEELPLIPRVNDVEIPEERIYVPNTVTQCQYLVMTSVDLKNPNETVDRKALLNSGEEFYITKSSIYVIQYEWNLERNESRIRSNFIRFKMKSGKIQAQAAASLKGQLTDIFAVNEYGGHLRVFLTDWSGSSNDGPVNRVYVLDENMKIRGTIENLAPGETIYSARFMGDKGYFVTYRNTDPLFSVDLSDPDNPEILGELKVTGFSEYLHFYGDGKLLGMGWETDPDNGQILGLKLSMYNIKNPKEVTEEKKLVIKDIDDCDALYDYKAVLVDSEKNLIGFTIGEYKTSGYSEKYVVFSYDKQEGFVKKMEYSLGGGEAYYSYESARGLYIGDMFYVAEEQRIAAFDMKNHFEKMGSLELSEEK